MAPQEPSPTNHLLAHISLLSLFLLGPTLLPTISLSFPHYETHTAEWLCPTPMFSQQKGYSPFCLFLDFQAAGNK